MTFWASPLLHVISSAAMAMALLGCGNGLTYGTAPGQPDAGPPPPPPDAGPPPEDAGPPPPFDAGPQPDAGDGCTTTTRELTPDEDFAEFTTQGVAAHFACASCHLTSGNPASRNAAWGPSDDADNVRRWFDGSVGLMSQPDQASLTDPTATRLYASFAGGIGGAFASQHLDNKPAAKLAVENWLTERMLGVTETICVDAGPAPDPDPVNCTPVVPSLAQSETRFVEVDVVGALTNCTSCHGSGRTPAGIGSAWGTGTATPAPADWHTAFRAVADREPAGTAIESSSMYTHFNGSRALHPLNQNGMDRTSLWLDYIWNGEPPAGCP